MSSPAQGQETKMTLLEQARMEALKDAASKDTKTEKEKSEAQGAQQTAKGVEELMQKQKDLIEKSKTQSAEKSAAPQKELSQKTKELASKANQSAGAKPESSQKAAAEKLEQAAKAMAEAAKDFEAGRKPEGQAKAQLAQKALADAHAAATKSSGDKLEQAIRQVVEHAEALLEDQKDLRTKTETTAKAMGSNPALDAAQAKDLQAQAGTQAGLQGRSVALNAEIVAFNDGLAKGAKPEIQTALKEAVNIIRRSQPEKAMAGAVVDLNLNAPGTAVGEQVKAEGTLAKIIESLRHADDAASASHAAQVKRAAEAAKQAQKSAQAAAQPKSAEAAQPKPGEAAQPKPAEGAQAKPGEAPQPKPGAQPKEGGAKPQPKDGGSAKQLAKDIARLDQYLADRDLVDKKETEELKEISKDQAELEKSLAVDEGKLKAVTNLVNRISAKLEAELESTADAGKLFSAQREECPPSYRQFVNKYFEALSEIGRPPQQAPKP